MHILTILKSIQFLYDTLGIFVSKKQLKCYQLSFTSWPVLTNCQAKQLLTILTRLGTIYIEIRSVCSI